MNQSSRSWGDSVAGNGTSPGPAAVPLTPARPHGAGLQASSAHDRQPPPYFLAPVTPPAAAPVARMMPAHGVLGPQPPFSRPYQPYPQQLRYVVEPGHAVLSPNANGTNLGNGTEQLTAVHGQGGSPIPAEADVLQGLSSRVAELLSHVHHALHPPALAILLLGQDESSAKAWFRDLLPPVANTHAWQVTLESWMLPVFRAMEADDAVAIDRVEAGLRALLDFYLLGSDMPQPATLYASWAEASHSNGMRHNRAGPPLLKRAVVHVDFLGAVMALLRLPTSGLRLLPVRPARLSAPGQDRPAWQGSPGRKRDLPERVAGLLGGVESAVASAGRDVRGMLAPREGLAMSPGADFGVWTWGSMERALYRQAMVWICNVDPSPVWLLDIRVVMQGARAFMLDDDFGLASRASGLPSSLGPFLGGGQHSGQEHGNGVQSALGAAGVMLTQGECYVITVKLNPHSQGEGMLAAAVVATLVRDCEDGAAPPTLFCAGWRATATMVPRGIASKLRPEAPPYIPNWQRVYFDTPAHEFSFLTFSQLECMLGGGKSSHGSRAWRNVSGGDDVMQCVATQQVSGSWGQGDRGLEFWRQIEDTLLRLLAPQPGDHVVSQGMKERVSGLVRLSRAMAVEEATMETDIRKHDMFGVRPQLCRHNPGERHYTAGGRKGIWSGFQVPGGGEKGSGKLAVAGGVSTDHFLMVEVKGLPERRPALEMGDSVFLGLSPQQLGGRRREFGCLVVAVSGAWVALVPPPSWWAVYGTDAKKFPTVNIRLGFDRVLLRRMGSAIVRAANHSIDFIPTWGPCEEEEEGGVRLLYKDLIHHNLLGNHHAAIGKEGKPAKAAVANFVNELLNKEQRAAVEAVVAGGPRNRPFILFGPAGTGKTLTLTEVILQALKQRPCGSPGQPRVLACAPTAFAADILCAGLARAGLKFGEMVRLNDIRRSPATVRPGVLEFCLLQSPTSSPSRRPVFGVDWDLLEKARVVVASCSSAAVLQPLLESRAGYDYVVVDEAAQALVPEALIPLTLAAQGGSSVTVLAGDPRQLGPTVRCRYSAAAPALRHSLQQLWLHRAGGGLGEDVHVLPRNYRSSAPLLELPSRMFYGDCLVAEAPEENTRVPDWDELAAPDDGSVGGGGRRETLFYGVMGKQVATDPVVPSWCNPLEAHRCVELVAGLLSASGLPGRGGVRAKEVGVMAPFRKQVYEIRRMLRERGLGRVRVGMVDDFQGQEARVVFISTTLSRVASLREEEEGPQRRGMVGTLLSDVQRFCVAITRAQALLVVVGHPVLLLEASTWRNLIIHCAARGAYKGAGADALAVSLGRGACDDNDCDHVPEDNEDDLADAVLQICQMAVLGSGDADNVFPDLGLPESLAAAYSEETPWRVAL